MVRVLLSIILLGLVLGCGKGSEPTEKTGKTVKVAYVTNGVASFWVIAKAGAEAAGTELGVNVSVQMPAQGIGDQKRIVEDLLTRGVDGIAISPIDPVNQGPLINDAAARTKLITHDSDAPDTKRLAYIGMDNYIAGRMAGELVKEALPNGGKIAIFIGRLEQDNARRRRQGTIDAILGRSSDPTRNDPPEAILSSGNYTIVGTLTDQFDRAKAKANCEDMLSRHPTLSAMVGLFAYNPPACLEALKQQDKLGKVQVIAFDEADETLQAITDGHCYGTVVQNPYSYGYESVKLLKELALSNTAALPKGGFMDIPARKIKRDNVGPFWEDLKQKLKNE